MPPHVSVRAEALGRAAGELTLALPWLGGDAIEQWASVVKDFDALRRADPRVTRVDRYQVPVITLDSLALPDVTAIKVDAEGAEEEVLRGAGQTLARCRPLLTVELEERHRAGCTRAVPALLGELGYRGFFVQAGALYPLEAFDAARLQVAPATRPTRSWNPTYFCSCSSRRLCNAASPPAWRTIGPRRTVMQPRQL